MNLITFCFLNGNEKKNVVRENEALSDYRGSKRFVSSYRNSAKTWNQNNPLFS